MLRGGGRRQVGRALLTGLEGLGGELFDLATPPELNTDLLVLNEYHPS